MQQNKHIIKKINEHYAFCKIKYQAHKKAAEKYNDLYNNTTIPIIILSSITTVLASYNGTPEYKWLATVVAIFSGITTICHALASFLEFKNKYQDHLVVSNKYIALARLIETELYVKYYSAEVDDAYITNIFDKIYTELLNIQNGEPILPTDLSDVDYSKVHFGVGELDDVLIDIDIQPRQSSVDEQTPLISPPLHLATQPFLPSKSPDRAFTSTAELQPSIVSIN